MVDLPQYGNVFPDDILARLRDLESAVMDLQDGTFAAVVTLAGDVTGDSSATVVGQLQGYPISSTAPSSGEVLEWDGSAWTPTALGGGTGDVVQSNFNTLTNSPLTYTSLRGTTQAPTWRMERSSGTGASPTALAGGLTIGAFTFGGYTGSAFTSSAVAGLFAKTTQTFTGSAQGTYLSLETTEHGTASRLEALRITDRGDLLNLRGFPSLRPDSRFAWQHRAASLYLAQAASSIVTEVWIADSTGHFKLDPVSDAETLSCLSVYETEMADLYCSAARTSGYMPVQQYGTAQVTGIQWDTVQGSRTARGPAYQNMRLTGSQRCAVSRDGTAVTVFYTAQDSGGGTATVTINGTTAGTITSTDGTLAAGTYDSGRAVTYTRSGYGPINLDVQLTSGTAFELEGAYFHNANVATGFMLIRADKSGQSMSYINDTPDPLMQVIKNEQPQLVTIQLGINDANPNGSYALAVDDFVAEFETLITNIRAQYSTWTPAIRYLFQNQSVWVPSDYSTTYRTAMRNACAKNDVLFIDGHDAVGSISGSDPLDFSDDTLHPNARGHWVWGQAVFDATPNGKRRRRTTWSISDGNAQRVTAPLGVVRLVGSVGASLYFGYDGGAAMSDNQQLGAVGFQGTSDAYGTLQFGAAIRADTEAAWTGSNYKAGLRFMTTATTSLAIRGGFSGDGNLFVGPTIAGAKFTVTGSTGDTAVGGDLTVTGALTAGTHPFLSVDGTFNTVTDANGLFGAGAFGKAPLLALRRAQGTSGSPTNITSGLNLATIGFYGYNSGNADYLAGATIRAASEEAWTTTGYRGTRLEFLTALSATNSAAVVRALINNAGTFYVGATAAGAATSIDQSGNASFGGTLAVTGNTTLTGTLASAAATVTQGTIQNAVQTLTSTATNDDPTEIFRQARTTTTDALEKNIITITPTASTQILVHAVVTARRTGGTAGTANDGAAYVLYATFKTASNGTVTQVGTTVQTVVGESQAGFNATIAVSGAGTGVNVNVTGATNNNVTWHSHIRTYELGT